MAGITLRKRISKRFRKSLQWLRGLVMVHLVLPVHRILRIPIRDLSAFQRCVPLIERREYSQNGEDGILHAIFAHIGTTNRFYVEFGAEDGMQCNTRYLRLHRGWTGLLMDGTHENTSMNLHKAFITAENIEGLFLQYGVPCSFDLLSIDIDGNDYWVWKAIRNYHPRVVVIEYNAHIPPTESRTIPYDPSFRWDGSDYYGASLLALQKLGEHKGYRLLGTDRNGVNAFFIQESLVRDAFQPPPLPALFHPPAFKGKRGNRHPPASALRPWVTI